MRASVAIVCFLQASFSFANSMVRANSIVRKEGDTIDAFIHQHDRSDRRKLSVEADGTLKDISSHMQKPASLMAMSVSAFAEMDQLERAQTFKRANSSSASLREVDESSNALGAQVWRMVHQVENFVMDGVTPDKSQVEVIREILEDELLPNLKKVRQTTSEQVQTHLEDIKRCNVDAAESWKHISDDTAVTVQNKRDAHSICRDGEKAKLSVRGLKCKELDDFLDQIHLDDRIPEPRSRTNMIDFVVSMDEYYCPKGCEGPPNSNAKVNVCTLSDACGVAEDGHAVHKSDCDALQAQFESGFCTWRTELADACFAQNNCYNLALKIYEDHVADAKELLSKWKVEYGALQKILCYVYVWLNDGNAKTVDGNQYGHCEDFQVDTSSISIDFGTPAKKSTCSMAAVAVHPGVPEFVPTEYGQFSDQVVETVACLELSTKLLAPEGEDTTLAPLRGQTTASPSGTGTTAAPIMTTGASGDAAKMATTASGDSTNTMSTTMASKGMATTEASKSSGGKTTEASKGGATTTGAMKMTTTPASKYRTTEPWKPTTAPMKTTEASKDSVKRANALTTTEASKGDQYSKITTSAEASKGYQTTYHEAAKSAQKSAWSTTAQPAKGVPKTTAEPSKR